MKSPPSSVFLVLILLSVVCRLRAQGSSTADSEHSKSGSLAAEYFNHWFDRVSAIQAAQPHWITPLVTVTPRLEEELRYDQMWESIPGGSSLTIYGGGGGKGLELIPFNPVEVIIGIPSWQTQDSSPSKSGWSDQSFLLKYRLLSGNEQNGDYILTAFLGLSVPNGSDAFSSDHFAFSPTIAFGKGWGNFDFQSTLGTTIPDNGGAATGGGVPVLYNTALQYRILRCFWPEVEFNYGYWPNGKHADLSQLFITPGLVVGRIPISGRFGLTFGLGCQFAVTANPLYRRNVILTARMPF